MSMSKPTRRSFIGGLGAAAMLAPMTSSTGSAEPAKATGSTEPASTFSNYEPWKPGMLDIHHISTGRGNSTLFLCPDGTSMMVDAGAIYDTLEYTIAPKPNGSRRPGEWLGRYAQRHLHEANRDEIDYFALTHLHVDHMGALAPGLPRSKDGAYILTGVSDVAEIVPIRRFIDRNYPSYDYPTPLDRPDQINYIEFIRDQVHRGASAEQIKVGSDQQIRLLRDPKAYPQFAVRNLAANGEVWTGTANTTRHHFPPLATLEKYNYPSENKCSLALRVSYGSFDYYTGGDLTFNDNYGEDPWRDIETPVAEAAGPVEVAVVNHHGYYTGAGPGFVRALRPQAFVILAWDSAHPTVSSLANMLSTTLYPGPRGIFATAVKHEDVIANRRMDEFKSQNGHVVVRVSPGGGSYRILILDNSNELDHVIANFGPYECR